MLQLARSIYMVDNPKYQCGVKREPTKSNILTIKEISRKINKHRQLFDMELYVSELNKASDTKLNETEQKVIVSDFILVWIEDIFTNLAGSLNQKEFERSFKNIMFFHVILNMLKPVELLKFPHYHLRLPLIYYQSLFEYESVLENDNGLKLAKLQKIFKLSNKRNCAYSTYTLFSTSNSIEQLEIQVFFLKKKFDFAKKEYAQTMLTNLIKTALQIINSQSWIKNETKFNIQSNIKNLHKTIAYSELVNESIKSNILKKALANGQSDDLFLTKYI